MRVIHQHTVAMALVCPPLKCEVQAQRDRRGPFLVRGVACCGLGTSSTVLMFTLPLLRPPKVYNHSHNMAWYFANLIPSFLGAGSCRSTSRPQRFAICARRAKERDTVGSFISIQVTLGSMDPPALQLGWLRVGKSVLQLGHLRHRQ